MPFLRSPHRRVPSALVGVLTVAAVLAAAGCDIAEAPGSTTAPEGTATTAPRPEVSGNPDTWPLTGLPVESGQSITDHPVLVAKIDNTSSSAPQVGLGSADLVVEEMVEGGVTRLAVFYYSEIPDRVGPVRSMRASDIGIVAPVDASVVTSGAAGVTIRRIDAAGIPFYEEETDEGFSRDSARYAPYNLFADLQRIADVAVREPGRPVDYLPFSTGDKLEGGQAATSVRAQFSASHTTTWSYARGGYTEDDGLAAEGDEFPADSVLVMRVEIGDAGYRDPAGNPVPETVLEGTGDVLLFHGGKVVSGTWTKTSLEAPLQLATASGPLTVPAGRTWIELIPASGGDVTYD